MQYKIQAGVTKNRHLNYFMDIGEQQCVTIVSFIKQLFHTNILWETPFVGYVVISCTTLKFLVKLKSPIKKYCKYGRIYQRNSLDLVLPIWSPDFLQFPQVGQLNPLST